MTNLLIVGERINSSNRGAKEILQDRNADALLEMARDQVSGGATIIDLNASMLMDAETEVLHWAAQLLLETFQVRISFDSPDIEILLRMASHFGRDAICNSLTSDTDTLDRALPALAETGAGIFIMLKSTAGIPDTAEGRIALAESAVSVADTHGIARNDIFLDPVFTPLATSHGGLHVVLETIALLRERFPGCHRVGGLSNVSFGLPMRRLLNRTFLAMAVARGLTAVICDPTDARLMDTLRVSEALTGLDPGCRELLRWYRSR
ncbi:MAG: dihydropteroate synthase [bacterium]|nr:MAG: dihydropteroate synthase [bacterium]